MANPRIRINIPKKPAELIGLAKRVNEKHLADGDSSPLKLLQKNAWSEVGPITATCLKAHEDAEALSRQAEELYRKRDTLLVQIDAAVKASRDVLTGIYRDEPKSLGNWGFEVDDSPPKPKTKANPA